MLDELLFPHDAFDAFRRVMLGDRYAPDLSAAQKRKLRTLKEDLMALSGTFRTAAAIPVVQRNLMLEIAAGRADPTTLTTLNSEIARARGRARQPSIGLPPDDYRTLYSTAAEIEKSVRREVASLEQAQALVASQQNEAQARMMAALKTGELPYLAINFTTGESGEGSASFWRSDAATEVWTGKRVRSDGSNAAALMMKSAAAGDLRAIAERMRHFGHEFGAALRLREIEAYFSYAQPAVVAAGGDSRPANPRHAEIMAAADQVNPGDKPPPNAKDFFKRLREELKWKAGPSDSTIKEALKGTHHLQKARRASTVQPRTAAG